MGKLVFLRQLLTSLLLIIPMLVIADVRVAKLYEIEVRVADDSLQARNNAQKKGLMQMFVRISGKVDIGSNPKIRAALKDYSLYIRQFRYVRKGSGENSRVSLWISMNRDQVNTVLRSAGLSVWGERRPNTVVWVAIDDGDRRYMLSGDDRSEAKPVMEFNARRRGTPLLFPLLDLEDRSKVRFSDIWGGFLTPIKKASRRYQTEGILVARVSRRGNGWFARWTLIVKGNTYRWTSSGQHRALVLSIGIDGAADKIAEHYVTDTRYAGKSATQNQRTHVTQGQTDNSSVVAVKPVIRNKRNDYNNDNNDEENTTRQDRGESGSQISVNEFMSANPPSRRRGTGFYISVKNIKGIRDYVLIARYIGRLSSVRSTKILKLKANVAVFEVIPRNSAKNVKRSISIGNTLVPVRAEIDLSAGNSNTNPNQREFANLVHYRYTK